MTDQERAEWLLTVEEGHAGYNCSKCGFRWIVMTDYCPNCGRWMGRYGNG